MSRIGQGGNGAVVSQVIYTPRRSREEKDKDILTCCKCGQKKVAKGNFYFCKTRSWSKRYQKYYPVEFYNRACIPCKNALDRKWSKDNPKEHREIVKRSWRRLHAKKPETRAKVFPEAYPELA